MIVGLTMGSLFGFFKCKLGVLKDVPLAGLLHVSRDWLVGPTKKTLLQILPLKFLGNARTFLSGVFSAVLGICQFLKHRIGTKKEVK